MKKTVYPRALDSKGVWTLMLKHILHVLKSSLQIFENLISNLHPRIEFVSALTKHKSYIDEIAIRAVWGADTPMLSESMYFLTAIWPKTPSLTEILLSVIGKCAPPESFGNDDKNKIGKAILSFHWLMRECTVSGVGFL